SASVVRLLDRGASDIGPEQRCSLRSLCRPQGRDQLDDLAGLALEGQGIGRGLGLETWRSRPGLRDLALSKGVSEDLRVEGNGLTKATSDFLRHCRTICKSH